MVRYDPVHGLLRTPSLVPPFRRFLSAVDDRGLGLDLRWRFRQLPTVERFPRGLVEVQFVPLQFVPLQFVTLELGSVWFGSVWFEPVDDLACTFDPLVAGRLVAFGATHA